MENLSVSIVQSTLHWENPEANLNMFNKKFERNNTLGDIIVLPEMFNTGFTMLPEKWAEETNGISATWIKEKAKSLNRIITGSISIKQNGKYFNRLHFARPDTTCEYYDKRHLFRMGKEVEHYSAGDSRIIVNVRGWKICPLICYDLRFPVWARNGWNKKTNQSEYDVLFFVANWPEVRSYPWKQLLIARAIENQCYVVGVNRIGLDGNGIDHSGDSVVINPRGEIISTIRAHEDGIETIVLSANYLEDFRKQFPVGLDADDFSI